MVGWAMRVRGAMGALLCSLAFGAMANAVDVKGAATRPPAEVEAALPGSHPTSLYAYAMRLFGEGRHDDAVMWFYAGQLRYRFHLRANPDLKPDGEPAVMASLNSTIGQTINEWAGGSPKGWAAAIDRALAWDEAQPNAVTSKTRHAAAWQETRKGLLGLRDHILKSEAQIRAERAQRGLPNR